MAICDLVCQSWSDSENLLSLAQYPLTTLIFALCPWCITYNTWLDLKSSSIKKIKKMDKKIMFLFNADCDNISKPVDNKLFGRIFFTENDIQSN